MTKYVSLLRGINVGGNNKVSMSDLRECFEAEGFTDVSTYINSGNIFFSARSTDESALISQCEAAIEKRFGFPVVVTVLSIADLEDALQHAPKWWASGDPKEFRNDALFVIPPATSEQVLAEILKKQTAVDRLFAYKQVVFWTLPRANYNKSVVPKIIGTPIYANITMRSSTTAKKLLLLSGAE